MIGLYNVLALRMVNLYSVILVEEEHIPEIHLINLTDWGWLLLLSAIVLAIWGLIVIQSNSNGSHPYSGVSDSDASHESENH